MMPRSKLAGLAALPLLACAVALLGMPACQLIYDGELGPVRCLDEGAFGSPACPPSHTCRGGTCVKGWAPLGAPCGGDFDCATPWFCLDPEQVGMHGLPFCSSGCCNSDECGPAINGLVCWPGQAGQLCLHAKSVGRDKLGDGRAGASCSDDAECRSGACKDQRCSDVCCASSSCDEGNACVVAPGPASHAQWTCRPPPAEPLLAGGERCNDDEDCATGSCLQMGGGVGVCAEACCSVHDCGAILVGDTVTQLVCASVLPNSNEPLGYNACVLLPRPAGATLDVGAPCDGNDACLSGICLNAMCSDVCCKDNDCGDTSLFSCRPVKITESGTDWSLRCVPK